jgi:hypothetical protein
MGHPIKFSPRFWLGLTLLFLSIGVLFQGLSNSPLLFQDLSRAAKDIGQPALWRSAMFSQGPRLADYILFLNKNIPTDARVVLPPVSTGLKELGTTPYMQFFLLPRQVINCTSPDCLADLSRENTYILVVDNFPGAEGISASQERQMFDETWGLMRPPGAQFAQGVEYSAFRSLAQVFLAALVPLLWLSVLTLAGFLLTSLLLPEWSALTRLPIGYGLGLSLFTFIASMIALAGIPLQKLTVLMISGLLLAIAVGFYAMQIRSRLADRREKIPLSSAARGASRLSRQFLASMTRQGLKLDPWLVVFLAVGTIATAISVGMGYHAADEIMLWGVKGYGIAAARSLSTVTEWGTNTLPYPLHVPILIASFRLLFGEVLPAAKMAFPIYYLALVLLVYAYLRDQVRLPRSMAGLAALLVATAPLVFRHGTIAYANLVLSFYLIAAAFLLTGWFEAGRSRAQSGWLFASGLFFTSAAWTRPEGLVLAWSGAILIFCIGYFKHRSRHAWRDLAWLVSPILLYTIFWYVLQASVYASLVSKSGLGKLALQGILSGNLRFGDAFYVIQSMLGTLFDLRIWGLFGIGLVLVVIAFLVPGEWRISSIGLIGCGLLYMGLIVGIYILASYDSVHDIRWWVNTGLDRMLMPAYLLLWVGGISRLKVFIEPRTK